MGEPTSPPGSPEPASRRAIVSQHRAIVYLVLAGLALYLSADLSQLGLALDGLVYANIASLLADGHGSLWALPFYGAEDSLFREHPPLGIWLESWWFRVFGHAFWVEKSLAAVLTLACCALTMLLYRELSGRNDLWLPVLLLVLMPASTYTLKNNFLESILTLATLAAVWGACRAARHPAYLLLTIFGVFAGLLIKGPAALFPLAAPLLLAQHTGQSSRQSIRQTVAVGGAVALLCMSLLLHAPAREALDAYWQQQLLPSVSGTRPIVNDRLDMLRYLSSNLGLGLLIVALICGLTRRMPNLKAAAPALLLALLASLPLLVSARHFRHYLLPSMPLYAIGLAMLCRLPDPPALPYRGIAALLLALALARSVWVWGGVGEDRRDIAASATIARSNTGNAVGFCESARQHDHLKAYLYRYHRIRSPAFPAEAPNARTVICASPPGADFAAADPLHGDLRVWQRNRLESP